eukprot:9631686-Alexandrium_andersonii.AAC.1
MPRPRLRGDGRAPRLRACSRRPRTPGLVNRILALVAPSSKPAHGYPARCECSRVRSHRPFAQ